MPAETRFVQTAAGPVAYRTDGAGGRLLVIVGDRADPYGPPGEPSYQAFIAGLADRGWRTLTLLDGIGPGAAAHAGGTERRIGAIEAVAEAAGARQAVLAGIAGGAPAAALAASGARSWVARLVLYAAFAGTTERAEWSLDEAAGSPHPGSGVPAVDRKDAEELELDLRTAADSLRVARELWQRWRGAPTAAEPAPPGRTTAPSTPRAGPPALAGLARLLPGGERTAAELGRLVERPDHWEGGLAELIQQVSRLEQGRGAGDAFGAIGVPTIVAQVRDVDAAGDPFGLEIAARIPGARHRSLDTEPALPWQDGAPTEAFLALLEDEEPRLIASKEAVTATAAATRILATLLFTDIVASTERLAAVGDSGWRELLAQHHAIVRGALARFGGREVDTAGDGFFASFPTPAPAIRCGLAAIGELAGIGLAVRCGLHTGECEQIGDKLAGIAVHVGARIASRAGGGEVLVSGTVRDLVAGSGITFADRGTAVLKGLPGTWPIFQVTGDTRGGDR